MKGILSAVSAALMLMFASVALAQPPMPGPHPAYLRALADLREAEWLVHWNSGNGMANGDELKALEEIRAAIKEIRAAAIDDGRDAGYQPPPDAVNERMHRLNRANKLMGDASNDLRTNEDNRFADGLRDRALNHIHFAILATEAAIRAKHSDT